jgi:nucleotide-binding universal stress UspA family protein
VREKGLEVLQKILIGCEGSPEGEDALALGRLMGKALDATAVVTMVVNHPRHGVEEDKFEQAVQAFCEPCFATARERLESLRVVEKPVVDGSPSRAFYNLADWYQPALLVIGSPGRGPAGKVLIGDFGISLLSGIPCSVAVAPRGYGENGETRELNRIGVAVDGGPEGWRALAAGAELARRVDQPLRLITVRERPHYVLGGLLSPLDHDEFVAYREREAESVLEEAVARAPDGVRTQSVIRHGDPAEALAGVAENLDLLILGSRAYGPVKGALLGSVSAKLMGSAGCPVMVVPRGAGPHPLKPESAAFTPAAED